MKQTRNTAQKGLIRGLLKNNETHPTAEEVFELARLQKPDIGRGTVYRNLNLLAESGEIHKLMMPLGPDHYDCHTHHHYHFLCRSCKCVLDAPLPYEESLNVERPELPGCTVEWHKLILIGKCADCNQKM